MAEEKSWDKFDIKEWQENMEEAAPRMKKDFYVTKMREVRSEIEKLENGMKAADSSRYSHLKRSFAKAHKAVAELTNDLNRKGATIPY